MDAVTTLLNVTEKWARKCGLDEDQIQRAMVEAWYRWRQRTKKLPFSCWARMAVRAVRNQVDLPWCGTPPTDALRHATFGVMREVMDRTPPPDVLVDHAERFERALNQRSLKHRQMASLRIQGADVKQVAAALNVSPGRVSQMARDIAEGFDE